MTKRFGPYELGREVGRGGMAVVYEAVESASGRRVALKLLTSPDDSGSDVKRLHREASLAAKLEHPNIVRIREVGVLDNTHYICMDYVDGPTLESARLDLRRTAEILEAVARAVHFAHEQGIYHRDLKPENVILDPSGRPVLVDFGLARNSLDSTRITQTDQVVGTPAYMAPEQVRGRGVDARCDVYALGVILFEAAAGMLPFRSPNIVELQRQIVEDEPTFPSTLDRDLRTILENSLQKDPNRRYPNAREWADDVRRWLDRRPIHAHPVGMLERVRTNVSRHRTTAAAAVAALLLAGAAGGYLAWERMDREDARLAWIAEGDAQRERHNWPEAMAAYEHALTIEPADARVRGLRDQSRALAEKSRSRLEEGARRAETQKRASEFYAKAESDLRMLRVRSYREDWRLTDAEFAEYEVLIRECEKQMSETGEAADGWWIIGAARHVMGDWPSAQRAYDAGLRVDPSHPRCQLHKARLLIEQALLDQFTRNIGNINGRVDKRFEECLALLNKGMQSGKLKEIELDIARGYAMAAANKEVKTFCADMLEKWKGHDFREEFFLIRGIAHGEGLIRDTTEALRVRPGFVEALFWRGVGYHQIHDRRKALKDYTRAIEIHPRFLLGYIGRAILHQEMNDADQVLRDSEHILRLNPRSSHGLLIRAMNHADQKNHDEAIKIYGELLEYEPDLAIVHFNRGLSYLEKKDRQAALRDYSRAIELEPTFAKAYIERGKVLAQLSDTAAGERDIIEGYRLDPKLYDACHAMGLVLFQKGQHREALQKMNDALAIQPRSAQALIDRGSIRNAMGDTAGALEDYTRGIELRPGEWKSHYNRGIVRQKTGDWAGAVEDYSKVIEAEPSMASAYANRGQIHFYLAEKDPSTHLEQAIFDLSKTLELAGPGYSGRAQVEGLLKRAQERSRRIREH